MSTLKAEHVQLQFPKQSLPVLQDVNLSIESGTLNVILGESGCGKTTLLNILAGFQKVDTGQVKIDDEVLNGPDARRAVVFQDHALLPWLNVEQKLVSLWSLKG